MDRLLPVFRAIPPSRLVKGIVLLLMSLLLVVSPKLSFGYTVTIGDYSTDGPVRGDDLREAVTAAEKAASELLREEVSLDGMYTAFPTLTFGGYGSTRLQLERELLASVPGIAQAYIVTVDGIFAGRVTDLSELAEISEGLLSEYATPEVVYCGFDSDIKARLCFTRADAVADINETAAVLRELASVDVICGAPDDDLIYVDGLVQEALGS